VSGGHTELVRVDGPGSFERLGRSHDDAAGECFDKVARLLGLGYPGGPAIEAAAASGIPDASACPRGGSRSPGRVSSLRLQLQRSQDRHAAQGARPGGRAPGKELPLADLAASFERVVAEVLVERSCRCAIDQGLETLVLVGGVAANRRLRQ
jgi:N6-L-threonylcarbamoyladenine synthase